MILRGVAQCIASYQFLSLATESSQQLNQFPHEPNEVLTSTLILIGYLLGT